MKTSRLTCGLAGLVACLGARASTVSYSFQTVAFPGADFTNAQGISSTGEVVGFYTIGSTTTGFTLMNGKFKSIKFPGAADTWVFGVNSKGELVGQYQNVVAPGIPGQAQGFTYLNGVFKTVNVPFSDAILTNVSGVNSSGNEVVGNYGIVGGPAVGSGFSLNTVTDVFTSINVPGSPGTAVKGLADNGDIAGPMAASSLGGIGTGFLYDSGVFSPIVFPGPTNDAAFGITPSGNIIVGLYGSSPGGPFNGFVLTDGTYTTLNFPGAPGTMLFGVNDHGVIVGVTDNASGEIDKSFIATPTPESATLTLTFLGLSFVLAARLLRGRMVAMLLNFVAMPNAHPHEQACPTRR